MHYLKCPVCNLPLYKNQNCYLCDNKHNYDISSKGYVNMLLANQRHSINPGDNQEMIIARLNFLKLDFYNFLREKIVEVVLKYCQLDSFAFCDLACGEGYYTNYIHKKLNETKKVESVGVDISKYAIIEACKKKKAEHLDNIDYFIGNLMNLPFLDNSFDFMLNCFALLDEKEFYRVLKTNGYFIRVLPDKDHLEGLKKVLYKKVIYNEEKNKHLEGFELIDEIHIHQNVEISGKENITSLFKMTPYYYKSSLESIEKLKKLNSLKTPVSFVLLVYKKV